MAQTGYSPISLYYSTTASAAPTAGNLVSGELAVNITDGVLFYKDNAGVVQTLATKAATSGTYTSITITGGTANGVGYLNGSKQFTTGSALTFDGTNFATTGIANIGSGARIQGAGSITGTGVGLEMFVAAGVGYYTSYDRTGGAYAPINLFSGTYTAFSVGFEQMRLTSTGLGIGTSSPFNKLAISGSDPVLYLVNQKTPAVGNVARLTLDPTAAFDNGTFYKLGASIDGYLENSSSNATALVFSNYNGSTLAEGMRLTSSGNLGIGTTSADKRLTVQTEMSFKDGSGTTRGLVGSPTWDTSYIALQNGTLAESAANAAIYQNVSGLTSINSASGQPLLLKIANAEAARIDSSGNFGVGTTTLTNSGGYATFSISGSTGGQIAFQTGGTSKQYIYSTSTDLNFYNSQTGNLIFYTVGSERARIDSIGNLLVGQTGQGPANSYSFCVGVGNTGGNDISHPSGAASGVMYERFNYGGSTIGSITQNGTTGVLYNITSDYRLKDVVGAVTGSGERIDALKPVNYTWKADGSAARGFLAHEFQEVYASSVTGTKDAVDEEGNPIYQQMQASTTEVIADLVAEIQSLRKRLAAAGIA